MIRGGVVQEIDLNYLKRQLDMSCYIKKKPREKVQLNIIPILDAVFIFIFFLLMSAQFLKVNEIASDAPSVKIADTTDDSQREPLNLTLEIFSKRIVIKSTARGKVLKSLPLKGGEYDLDGLLKEIIVLKKNHLDESSVILKPTSAIAYSKIVKVIDVLRELPSDEPAVSGVNRKGEEIQTRKLFNQIIFETII